MIGQGEMIPNECVAYLSVFLFVFTLLASA